MSWAKGKRSYASYRILLLLAYLNLPVSSTSLHSRDSLPSPISIPPSQDWDGNDGPWSSFALQAGTPAQSFKVLISTSSSQTWLVTTEGCVAGDPVNCAEDRGGLWNRNDSSTYVKNTVNTTTDIYGLDLEENLGYTGKGRYGSDTVMLGFPGSGGPALVNQTIAGIATKSFFMGMFGLNPTASNFTSINNSFPSFLQTLRKEPKIPGLSWAYNAGNQYRSSNAHASLTLGGYDSTKFVPNQLTFPFGADDRDLTVTIQSITSSSGTALLPSSIPAFLDSSIPYIYLPADACTAFEQEFGLSWNSTLQLYLVSETNHALLLAKNPNITFSIGTSATEKVDITFPYAAFDLQASFPLIPTPSTSSRYFPLRRAANDTQYTLGRTFFQEAYIIADYDRRNFSVSQSIWNSRAAQILVPIYAPGIRKKRKFPIGAIAGVAAGGALLIASVALYFFWYRPRHQKKSSSELDSNPVYHPIGTGPPGEAYIKAELDASEYSSMKSPDIVVSSPTSGGRNKHHIAEIGGSAPIYEMAAREEVAYEMGGLNPASPDSYAGGGGGRSNRRGRQPTQDTFGFPNTPVTASNSVSSNVGRQDARERERGRDAFGFPTSPGSNTISSSGSSLRVSPQSAGAGGRRGPPDVSQGGGREQGPGRTDGSPIVSPASGGPTSRGQREGQMRRLS